MKKRILILLFALLLSAALLVSCGNGNPEETTQTPDTTVEETQPQDEGIVLFAPGVCEYRIV